MAAIDQSKHTNRLAKETSPYLLQHAHNPVDWYPWGEEALQKARQEEKVILVSIGYSACHWCHVMERESFEDEATAQLMNELFINIKIDREERPDLDHVYMEAVQAISGSGGWPLNVFLTPEKKPFYGGTYFPPVPAHGRSSWKDVLISIADAWQRRRPEIEEQANTLIDHIQTATPFISTSNIVPESNAPLISDEALKEVKGKLLAAADKTHGGFGAAPKFLQTQSIKFLLQHFHYFSDVSALAQAELSLKKMLLGGIYDQVGGGISRYSTDDHWLVPHFEKMLYDNALLLEVIAHAYSITKKPIYRFYLQHTFQFLIKEMKDASGGFYAALDADSEGIEGKYYLWDIEEIQEILADKSAVITGNFNISKDGNVPVEHPYWKNKNVLFADKFLETNEQLDDVKACLEKLKARRDKRIPPSTDDKIIMSWNSLLITAFSACYKATAEPAYMQEAVALQQNLERLLLKENIGFFHACTKGLPKHDAYLDDLAHYTQALLCLQEITGDPSYLNKAKNVALLIDNYFYDNSDGYCFYASASQTDSVVRKKEFYDSASTSANAVHAENLIKLAAYFQEEGWNAVATTMLTGIREAVLKYPTSFASWAVLLQNQHSGLNEIAIVGAQHKNLLLNILQFYCPFSILMTDAAPNPDWELLKYSKITKDTYIYLCRNQLCFKPTIDIAEFIRNSNAADSAELESASQ